MDREELVARVTREVMDRLGLASGATTPGAALTTVPGECDPCTACGLCVEKRPNEVDTIVASGADRISTSAGVGEVGERLAGMIDHTLLAPTASREEITRLCEEARRFRFASVCINPCYVPLCAQLLRMSNVKVCTVVGFPLGANRSEVKAFETARAIDDGAQEVDMVANIGAIKSRDHSLVESDIRAVVEACRSIVVSKVIIEAALLTDEEKVTVCELARKAGADFVKTSTGFGPGGATAHDVALMRGVVGSEMGVKAAGGIRDLATATEMIAAGASRIGASASVKIVGG
ncbi:MAG: deoxyribose-phosphate aldolase [Candidatus Eisenbacteria bacterium]|nr:deoxyribose-phosphate aldolase [Candidatus Eisenbacteria bacterium]